MRDAVTEVPEQIERKAAAARAEETSDNDQGLDRLPVVRITSLYLRDLRRLPLLTSHEEIELAKQIEAGRKAQDQMMHITDPIERLNLEKQAADGIDAKNRLWESNCKLVVSIAKRYNNKGVSFDD